MTPLYRLATAAYHQGIAVAGALGNTQARQWVSGRQEQLTPAKTTGRQRIWMHCASLGEWEQGRPVLQELRQQLPEWEAVLTFYSPSGFTAMKDLNVVDHVLYLPADSKKNAEKWVADLAPDLAIFVKYEFWYYHLQALSKAGVPTWLVAAHFRPEQAFFKFYGAWFRTMLRSFDGIVCQNEESRKLLITNGKYPREQASVGGDPRMDRTLALTTEPFEDPLIAEFCSHGPTIIAGSVWPDDLVVWEAMWKELKSDWRIILAPHKLKEESLVRTQANWSAIRYTQYTGQRLSSERVLLLDTMGMLSKVYRYGKVAYIGGGFKTGLHNTLEPMAYGLPVIFGPNHQKFPEAATAIKRGGAFAIGDEEDLLDILHEFSDAGFYRAAQSAQQQLAQNSAGAGERTAKLILKGLEKRQILPT